MCLLFCLPSRSILKLHLDSVTSIDDCFTSTEWQLLGKESKTTLIPEEWLGSCFFKTVNDVLKYTFL